MRHLAQALALGAREVGFEQGALGLDGRQPLVDQPHAAGQQGLQGRRRGHARDIALAVLRLEARKRPSRLGFCARYGA